MTLAGQIADSYARLIKGKKTIHPGFPSSASIARHEQISKTTARRVQGILAEQELIRQDENRRYYLPGKGEEQ